MKKHWVCSLVLPGLLLAALPARQAAAQMTMPSCSQQRQQVALQIRSLELRRATQAAECAKADGLGLQSCNEMKNTTAQQIQQLRIQESELANCIEPSATRNSQGANGRGGCGAIRSKDKDGDNENYDKNPKDQGKASPPATDADKSKKHPKNEPPGEGRHLKDLQPLPDPSIKSQSQSPQSASHAGLDAHISSSGRGVGGNGVQGGGVHSTSNGNIGGMPHGGGTSSSASSVGGASHSSSSTSSSGGSRPK
ncbi:MAG TPA: hypothetical protein VNV88_11505 [Candidatus Solibacter sp.]|jgi:hypothetical protein|nr:hypothetical protein [Candidatus Solibacter sp.]